MIHYGEIAVPWAAMWSEEAEYFVAECPYFQKPAICQREAQGRGVPKFGSPHVSRQRKLHALCLCDICAKPLKTSTKISMSNFGGTDRPGMVLTQSEPLSHVECAQMSLQQCPSLKRQAESGRLRIRQVYRFKARATVATAAERIRFVPDYKGPAILGLAVVDLLGWRDITEKFVQDAYLGQLIH
jgi:hypothetical protein